MFAPILYAVRGSMDFACNYNLPYSVVIKKRNSENLANVLI